MGQEQGRGCRGRRQIKPPEWLGGGAGEKGSSHGESRGGSQEGKSLATFSPRDGMQAAPCWALGAARRSLVEEEVSLKARLCVAPSCQGSLLIWLCSRRRHCAGAAAAAIVLAGQEAAGHSGRSPSTGRRESQPLLLVPVRRRLSQQLSIVFFFSLSPVLLFSSLFFLMFCGETGC